MRWVVIASLLLVGCKDKEPGPPEPAPKPTSSVPGIELAMLAGYGTVPVPEEAPVLMGTLSSLTLDGKAVLALHDGAIAPEELEGGARGIMIPRVTDALAARAKVSPPTTLAIALDHRLTYRVLLSVLFSAKQKEAGWKRFALLAQAGGKPIALPIMLPDMRPSRGTDLGASISKLAEDVTEEPATIARLGDVRSSTDAGSLTPAMVNAKIQAAYMAGIERCYKEVLRTDPAARGTLKLTLNVTTSGRLEDSKARGVVAETCVTQLMATWRFPIPKDADGKPTSASFQISLNLVPGDEATRAPAAPTGTATTPAPAPPPSAAPSSDPDDQPLRMFVSVTANDLLLWSASGLEGTLSRPRLRIARADPEMIKKLGDALGEIVLRRWSGRQRPEATYEIILQADGATPLQIVSEVMAALRATPNGDVLFPDVLLSSGFE